VQNEEFKEPINQFDNLNNPDYNAPLAKELAALSPEPEIFSPNNPPWSSPVAFGVWFLSVLAIIIFPIFFIVPYVLINNLSLESIQNDTTAILLNLISIIPAHLFTVIIAWLVATRNGKFFIGDTMGFNSGGFRWWAYPLILIGFFVLAVIVNYFIPEGDNDLLRILRSSRTAVFITAVLATFTAPLVEEFVYRGVLYSAFQRTFGVNWAVVTVTLLFALVHVPQYLGSPGTILLICLLSLVLTLIRVKSDNILPCIIMHTIFNGIQSVILVLEPYLPKPEANIPEQAASVIKFFT
jgi:uncharacterized protein